MGSVLFTGLRLKFRNNSPKAEYDLKPNETIWENWAPKFHEVENLVQSLGVIGEEYCVEKLKALNYKIIARNYRIKQLELDIVAQQGKVLIFIEVKTRAANSYNEELTALTYSKKKKIGKAIKSYIYKTKYEGIFRFDYMEVNYNENSEWRYRHWKQIKI